MLGLRFGLLFCGGYPEGHRIKHVLVKLLFPGAVLRQVHFEFGESQDNGSGHLRFTGPAITANVFFHGAGRNADHFELLPFAEGLDLVSKDIEQRGIAVIGKERFFHHQHSRFQIRQESQDHPATFFEGEMRGGAFAKDRHPVVEQLLFIEEGHAHIAGAGVNGQNIGFAFWHKREDERRDPHNIFALLNYYPIRGRIEQRAPPLQRA